MNAKELLEYLKEMDLKYDLSEARILIIDEDCLYDSVKGYSFDGEDLVFFNP